MSNTLVCAAAVCGLVSSCLAQTLPPSLEVRIVADGQDGAPTGPGTQAFPIGSAATRIGLTVQARVITHGRPYSATNPQVPHNYGVFAWASMSVNNLSSIVSRDAASGALSGELRRGSVAPGLYGAFAPFRFFVGPSEAGGETGNPVGSSFPTTLTDNGLIGPSAIRGMVPARRSDFSAVDDGNGNPTIPTDFPIDYGVGTNLNPAISPWQNLYRVYLDPTPGAAPLVRISASGRYRMMIGERYFPDIPGDNGMGIYILGSPPPTDLITTVDVDTSITLLIPAPTSACVLGLASLLALRRRRA